MAALYFDGASKLRLERLGNIRSGQDGAIYRRYIFHFDTNGECDVFSLETKSYLSSFRLDKSDIIAPHSNAVAFGSEFYSLQDEFPLLYTNIYNNYSNSTDRKEGTCLVYRLARENGHFCTKLVQVIKIGFVNDEALWCSDGSSDIRPYGNFAVDAKNNEIYAFTMRDNAQKTRFFKFKLPSVSEGERCEKCGAIVKTLEKGDIAAQFDTQYMHFMQGASFCGRYIYSVEGFSESKEQPPALRVIDVQRGEEVLYAAFSEYGLPYEPEFIEAYDGKVYYADGRGELYSIKFE